MFFSKEYWVRFPTGLFSVTALIVTLGLFNLASASRAAEQNLHVKQMLFVLFGTFLGFVFTLIPTRRVYELSVSIYLSVVSLLVLVLFVGTTAKGAKRWIAMGFFNLQPSELAKLALIFAVARFLSQYFQGKELTLRNSLRPLNITRPLAVIGLITVCIFRAPQYLWWPDVGMSLHIINFMLLSILILGMLIWVLLSVQSLLQPGKNKLPRAMALVDVIVIPVLLVMIEPDLGTGLVMFFIAAAMLLFWGIKRSSLAIAAVVMASMVFFGYQVLLKDYQKRRVEAFLDPSADLQGSGYQAAQSVIAIGSGQMFGKGRGEGTQTQLSFLPENHTDYIFSVLAEEWGFIGSIFLLILYALQIFLMVSIGMRSHLVFGTLLSVGAAFMVFFHVLVNVGMVTGLLPVVGVTLPFMSKGGSSMLTQIFAVFMSIHTAVWRRAT